MPGSISYRQSTLCYYRLGQGAIPLLLFHGFGQDHHAFDNWAEFMGDQFSCYAFDIYFHGSSNWTQKELVTREDWHVIMTQFLEQEKISDFEIAGFSLGARFAMATLEAFSSRVKRMILLAPDGIGTNVWYSLATFPVGMQPLFRSMIHHPGRFYALARMCRSLRLIDKVVYRFASSQMNSEEKRRRVYCAWVYFRKLEFSMERIATILNQNQIPLLVVAGRFDTVIPATRMDRLLRRVKNKRFEFINSGHRDLVRNAAAVLQRESTPIFFTASKS